MFRPMSLSNFCQLYLLLFIRLAVTREVYVNREFTNSGADEHAPSHGGWEGRRQHINEQEPEHRHFPRYIEAYLPPADRQYSDRWTGDGADFRSYINNYAAGFD